MNPTPKITIVSNGDDWEGLYLDGRLVDEGGCISAYLLLKALGLKIETVEVSRDWLKDRGKLLPEKLSKVPKKVILP